MTRPPVATPPAGVPVQAPTGSDTDSRDLGRAIVLGRADVIAACQRARADATLREAIALELIDGIQAFASAPDAAGKKPPERALLSLVTRIVTRLVSEKNSDPAALSAQTTHQTVVAVPAGPPPHEDPARREGALRLLRELESLPEELRRPVTLHFLGGHDFPRIAASLRLTEAEAKLQVHHGLMALRQKLGEKKHLLDLLPLLAKHRRENPSGGQQIV